MVEARNASPDKPPLGGSGASAPPNVPVGFWSGETLFANQYIITPFHPEQIDCNSYKLRMGDRYFVTSAKADSEPPTKTIIDAGSDFAIPPGQFAFLISKEEVHIPHYAMAFISMRTQFKFDGLVNVSGFHVDPGYNGKLIFAVYNASPSPVQITAGEELFKIWFASMDRQSGQKYLYDKPGITDIDKGLTRGMSRELLSLQQLNEKIREVEETVNNKMKDIESDLKVQLGEYKPTMDNLFFVWRAINMGVIGALILWGLSVLFTITLPPIWSAVWPVTQQLPPATKPAPSAP